MRKEQTEQEYKLWQLIRNAKLGVKFRRQFPIDNKYIADFICLEKRLIIEIDGGQHNGSFSDVQRTFYLEKQNFRVIRFWNNEIDNNIEGCYEFLTNEISSPSPHAGADLRTDDTNVSELVRIANRWSRLSRVGLKAELCERGANPRQREQPFERKRITDAGEGFFPQKTKE